ncbi:PIN domain-containing protein [Gryllotalpicola protaetiae]|uniref:Ribonuclease VapC n=1 Tax=Gryllotalpicola protaetiae TaxID=2419771 RepID=A0A387BP40_9MICO|nr:PIN domain-containing protein [Gryllotalpicola protaetiae]AYG04478.1 PIN domain-containing protein [Gryllotalpicola protaetiae]
MTTYYVDASVALRALLGHSPSAAVWIDAVSAGQSDALVSSRLLRTELTRVLRREELPVRLRDEVLDVFSLVPVTEGVLAAAESIEPPLKTLDAIHLGSVIASGLDATVVTHDLTMQTVAERLGYPTFDPVTE